MRYRALKGSLRGASGWYNTNGKGCALIRTVIVEDEPATRDRYSQLVSSYGEPFVVVETFETARSALGVWSGLTPDFLLADIRMPKMNGLELIENLRRDGWDGVAVVVSGYGEFSLAQEALRAGVYDYLLKPVFPDDLRSVLLRVQRKVLGDQGYLSTRVLRDINLDSVPEFVRKAISFADTHVEEHISLSDAADAACVSATYLSSAFTRECGLSFIDFLHRLRVEKAKQLLEKSDLSLLDVAEQSGLTDKSYLNRIFRRVTGTTPGEYRRSVIEGPRRRLDNRYKQ